jgi:predicted alpha/beta hydrolase family esterase
MKNAIILHGKPGKEEYYDSDQPSSSNYHWLPWLQKQLMVHDIKADTPEAPHSYAPDYDVWRKEVERFEIGPETMLVGHSAGTGFWLRYLSEHPELKVGKVVLVAPSFGLRWTQNQDFMKFTLDKDLVKRTKGVTVFISDNDDQSNLDAARKLEEELNGANIRWFHGYGHFIEQDMKTDAFPELLEECLKPA